MVVLGSARFIIMSIDLVSNIAPLPGTPVMLPLEYMLVHVVGTVIDVLRPGSIAFASIDCHERRLGRWNNRAERSRAS